MIGNIPTKVVYISQPPKGIEWGWDDFERKYVDKGDKVLPTFVADPEKPKTVETGRQWAGWGNNSKQITEQTFDNKPFDIRIVSLEHRSQGGRAYKVIIAGTYYVDLREDVLLDTILEAGIQAGGVPNAKFIWGKVGSQMKLVRVGSELHTELIKSTEDKTKSKLSPKDLEVGGVYQNRKGDLSIYMGMYWVFDFDNVSGINNYDIIGYKNYRWTKRQLWYELSKWEVKREKGFSERLVNWNSYYAYKWVKQSPVIEKVSQIVIPDNWKELLTDGVKESYKTNYSRYEKDFGDKSWKYKLYYSKYLSLLPISEKPVLNNDPFLDEVRSHITHITTEIEISTK